MTETVVSIPALLARNADRFAKRAAYREKEFGIWQSWTWAETRDEIEALALGLIDAGLQPREHVIISGRNRPGLYWAMVAVQCAGGIPVPIYQDAAPEEIAYQLDHAEAVMAIVGDQEQVDKITDAAEGNDRIRKIVYLDPRGLRKYDHDKLIAYADLQDRGRAKRDDLGAEMQSRRDAAGYDDTCIMLYTSGTTGRPKGVVYSHRGAWTNAVNNVVTWEMAHHPVYLWTLPLFHCNGWCFPWTITMLAGTHVFLRAPHRWVTQCSAKAS